MFTQYQEHGVDYIVALLKGYENAAAGRRSLPPGMMYNKYFPGHAIAMPPPLSDGRVDYTDGAPATLDQYSKDVTAFLMWAAEPHLEQRKRIGHAGDDLPDRVLRSALPHQEEGVARGREATARG